MHEIYNKAYCETCFPLQFQLRSCNGIFLPIINEKVENIVRFMKVSFKCLIVIYFNHGISKVYR